MKSPTHSIFRIYGIFVFVATLCLAGMIAGFVWQIAALFWIALLLFSTFGIIRILIILQALRSENLTQAQKNSNLQKEQSQLRTLVNSLGEAILAVNVKGEITLYNAAALELIDSHNEPNGQSLQKVFGIVDAKNQPVDIVSAVIREGKIVTRDDVFLQRDSDGQIPLYVLITPINEQGEIVGAIIMARDIAKQKTLQAQKDEFLSVVSHELRTPVAIVEADLSTVLLPGYTELPEKASKLLRSASQNITYLSGLLQDISDLSHSERLVLDVELQSVDCQAIAKELTDDFKSRAEKAGLELRLETDNGVTGIVSSSQRINEILVNFLTNAIKYSAGVGKTINFRLAKSSEYEGGVRFDVQDEGLGISEEDQAKLFTKFYRSSDPTVQAIKGTGMGLYITAQQAKKIGGHISMHSELKKGSTFSLDLPARVPSELVAKTNS
jgi:PAS domain S-box-containing protein